ncbi:glycosyltransferase family 2 protein [Acidihalobacter ferrooxydans]|uniref:Glycosyl transferase n=1 Tax=Acidihalobacter ferrooxydans TaxID=1765967 RepID=A0A1P8UJI8_9GAMM|nr:glycosyltransferase family 2 protein [Acidihalobacter ferrooxydans]APZ43964.1 glycosyl transferase [Acidihalobacter ferrooxydans]
MTQTNTDNTAPPLSIVLPARNEADNLPAVLDALRTRFPDAERILVDDGSTDDTAAVARAHGARVVSHPYGMGNGAAIKSGARLARGDLIVFMDADGQHDPADVERLLAKMDEGYDMVVGARNAGSQASVGRLAANTFYNRLASWVTGHKVLDLTSGLRAARADRFRQFLYLLPNGFSYPTTSTMAFFRAGYAVGYLPIRTRPRGGKSHIRPLRDGLRFVLIIFKIGTLYSPLKVFAPASAAFALLGLARYAWTLHFSGTFTNMSALLLMASALTFLMGLISEQISNLMYANTEMRQAPRRREDTEASTEQDR